MGPLSGPGKTKSVTAAGEAKAPIGPRPAPAINIPACFSQFRLLDSMFFLLYF